MIVVSRILSVVSPKILAGLALLAAPAGAAVTFNLDLNTLAGTPPSTFGGDATQPGTWNSIGAGPGVSQLVDLSGAPSGVFMQTSNTLNGASGGSDPLRSDYVTGIMGVSPVSWAVNLTSHPLGQHTLWVYASDNTPTGAFTVDAGGGPVAFGSLAVNTSLAIPINVTGAGTVSVVGPADGSGVIAGLQMAAIPEPSAAALITLALFGAMVGHRRR